MGAQGTTTLNFGAFPGASDTSVAITGQTGILSGSLVEAWLIPITTSDHSTDEHNVETISIRAGNIVAGTGFTIYGFNAGQLFPANGLGTLIYGAWTVAWVWN